MAPDIEEQGAETVAVGRICAIVLFELFSICLTIFSGIPEVYRYQTQIVMSFEKKTPSIKATF